MPYSLEVCEMSHTDHGSSRTQAIAGSSPLIHVGYMSQVFKTKQHAAYYYDAANKHMRQLNAYGTWESDCDPVTHLKYIVREWHNINATIRNFRLSDHINWGELDFRDRKRMRKKWENKYESKRDDFWELSKTIAPRISGGGKVICPHCGSENKHGKSGGHRTCEEWGLLDTNRTYECPGYTVNPL